MSKNTKSGATGTTEDKPLSGLAPVPKKKKMKTIKRKVLRKVKKRVKRKRKKKPQKKIPKPPKDKSLSYLEFLFFTNYSRLFNLGSKRTLKEEDLFPLHSQFKTVYLSNEFDTL